MNAEDLIQDNNEKRKELTKENLDYYEEMLVYIRLSFDKSEQETEEVLSELLDHLIEAQDEGKSAEYEFGNKPKQYANEIIGELPKALTKKRIGLIAMGLLYLLATYAVFTSLVKIIGYYVFNLGEMTNELFLGSLAVKTIINILIDFLLVFCIIQYLRWASFKKINKVKEFFLTWLIGSVVFGVIVAIIYFMPTFGTRVEVSIFFVLLAGIIFWLAGRVLRKAI